MKSKSNANYLSDHSSPCDSAMSVSCEWEPRLYTMTKPPRSSRGPFWLLSYIHFKNNDLQWLMSCVNVCMVFNPQQYRDATSMCQELVASCLPLVEISHHDVNHQLIAHVKQYSCDLRYKVASNSVRNDCTRTSNCNVEIRCISRCESSCLRSDLYTASCRWLSPVLSSIHYFICLLASDTLWSRWPRWCDWAESTQVFECAVRQADDGDRPGAGGVRSGFKMRRDHCDRIWPCFRCR